MKLLPLRQELQALQRLTLRLAQTGDTAGVGYLTAVGLSIRREAGDPAVGAWPLPGDPVPAGWPVVARVTAALADDWAALRGGGHE